MVRCQKYGMEIPVMNRYLSVLLEVVQGVVVGLTYMVLHWFHIAMVWIWRGQELTEGTEAIN